MSLSPPSFLLSLRNSSVHSSSRADSWPQMKCDSALKGLGLPSIFPEIFQAESIKDIVTLHCALFSLQYSTAMAWLDSGLQVDTMVGHSFGQLTALCVSGCLSLTDAVRLIAGRARLVRDNWGDEKGLMLAVEGDGQELDAMVALLKRKQASPFEIVCYNGPRSFVIAGAEASIQAFEDLVRQSREASSRFKLTRLKNTHAYHSHLADSILPGLEKVAQSLEYGEMRIPVETCSRDANWTSIGPEEIVQHTRLPVYFSDAVQRITSRLGSCIWVEAGSSSPIISMTRRVVEASSDDSGHVLIPLALRGPDAERKLASTAGELWKAGSTAAFWPFHSSQQSRYGWLNLPPYQFEKTRHWIDYKPHPYAAKSMVEASKDSVVAERNSALLQLLGPKDHAGFDDNKEVLFAIDRTSPLLDLCTRGHAVAGQGLCPASMYAELAARGAACLRDLYFKATGTLSTPAVPQVENLAMSSPLGVGTVGSSLFMSLKKVAGVEMGWDFCIFSRKHDGATGQTRHAVGRVTLPRAGTSSASVANGSRVVERLVGRSRQEEILCSPAAAGLHGSMVYKVFGSVVDYAGFYRGVVRVVARDREAVGHVRVPADQPSGLEVGACNPVVLDNFLQVAGIHVNCLSERSTDEVFVCTEIQGLSLSEQFMADRAGPSSWDVFSRFNHSSTGAVENDIFVFDSSHGSLVALITGATFKSVPFKSLARSLSKLNRLPDAEAENVNGYAEASRPPTNGLVANGTAHQHVDQADATATRDPKPNGTIPNGVRANGAAVNGHTLNGNKHDHAATHNPSAATNHHHVDSHASRKASTNGQSRATNGQSRAEGVVKKVCEMIGDIMEMPVGEIEPKTTFTDLGVDSLVATEVLTEIQKRFDIKMTQAEFQAYETPLALGNYISSRHQTDDTSEPDVEEEEMAVETQNGHRESHTVAQVGQECFGKFNAAYETSASETGFAGFCSKVLPIQTQLVTMYVVEAFEALGCSLASMPAGQRLPNIPYVSQHSKLVPQLYKILEHAGLISRESRAFYRTTTAIPDASSDELHDAMLARFPQHASETKLLRSTGPRLADCLSGHADPLALIFKDAKARALLEDVYTNAPMFKAGTLVLAEYLSQVIGKLAASNGGREIKILELGAGTGGTTKTLIEELSKYNNFSYTFTDLSASLVAAAKKKFARHAFMNYAVLDVERDPAPQFLGEYDIVISTNCIHATKNLVRSCGNIKKLLRPDGMLCLVELTRNLFWFDLVFGLLSGWWLFEDGREHALASEARWQSDLRTAGFAWADWTDGPSDESDILRVIVACPESETPATGTINETNGGDLEQQETVVFKKVDGVELAADIYYPANVVQHDRRLPIGRSLPA